MYETLQGLAEIGEIDPELQETAQGKTYIDQEQETAQVESRERLRAQKRGHTEKAEIV
jgi:hypothetical protein